MSAMPFPEPSITGYHGSSLLQDQAWATYSTGADIGSAVGDVWAFRFEIPALRVKWEAAHDVAFPFIIRLNVGQGVSPTALKACAHALTEAWNSTAAVPPVFRFTDLISEASELSFGIVGHRYEVAATLTDQHAPHYLEKTSPTGRSASGPRSTTAAQPSHARLSKELREMSGLSAFDLGRSLGVTREQYSRWTSGKPISEIRHGQLQFLHTVLRELIRRLGADNAKVWLRTPIDGVITPADLMRDRRFDSLYQMISSIQDPEDKATRNRMALSAPLSTPEYEQDHDDDPWNPYEQAGTQVSGEG